MLHRFSSARPAVIVALSVLCAAACGSVDDAGQIRIEPLAGAGGGGAGTRSGGEGSRAVTVFLDAGHGGRDPGWGASYVLPNMPPEKDLNLDMAERTAAHLEQAGFRVVLSRATDTDLNEPERDINGDGVMDVVDEMQARIDAANASGAAVLLSLHFNGLPGNPQLGGASTWYNTKREFSDKNLRLAKLIQEAQLKTLTDLGYPPRDWGTLPDDIFNTPSQAKIATDYKHLMLIGPVGPYRTRPSRMPGAVAEPLFLTNPKEAALANSTDVRDALARAYARAIREFLNPDSSRAPDAGGGSAAPRAAATSSPAQASGVTGGSATLVDRGQSAEKVVALTFDAGAETGHTAAILDLLARRQIKGTFGLTGAWCEANPELARRITAEGHAVLNHTFSHTSWTGRSPGTRPLPVEQRRQEVERAEQALQRTTGVTGRPFFRSPYGDEDAGVQRDLGEMGYRYNVLWTFDSRAWRGIKATEIVEKGVRAARAGAIYVFHVAEQQDALALAPLIDGLVAAGYSFVTVPQMLPSQ